MPEQYKTEHEREAFELGAAAGIAAASWVADGNTSAEHISRVLAMMDAGDPEMWDYLPAMPDLSGEWADAPTPASLYEEVTGFDSADRLTEGHVAYDPHGETIDAIADAWEAGVSSTFEFECERILRAMAPECPGLPDDEDCLRDPFDPCEACIARGNRDEELS